MIACILYRKDVIDEFIIQREKYDNYVLLNQYDDALKVVEHVESWCGVSYWSTECKFFLYKKLGKNITELLQNVTNVCISGFT